MDFSYLIELAQQNDKSNAHQAKQSKFSTKVSVPKKVSKASPNVSAIKAILDKKDEDKVKAHEEFKKKRDNLLALRAQDRKANQRVSAMINRTKGASKSVLDDAKDITTARGEAQCDEDDYGYESAMSQQIFSKLANTYASMPEDNKLKFVKASKKANIDDIKSRVINSLKKEEEEEFEPKKRKRKSKFSDDGFINDGDAFDVFDDDKPAASESSKSSQSSQKTVTINYTNYKSDRYNNFKYDTDKDKKEEKPSYSEKEKKKPKKPAAPPPMSFMELMKVAKQKQSDPIKIEKKPEKVAAKEKESDRPLTAKEKEELEDQRRRKLKRLGKLPSDKKDDNSSSDKSKKNGEVDKGRKDEKSKGKSEGTSKLQQALEKPKSEPKVIDRSKYFAVPGAPRPKKEERPLPSSKDSKSLKTRDFSPKDIKPMKSRDPPPMRSRDPPPMKSREPPPMKSREPPPMRSREPPPMRSREPPMKSKSRPFPPPDVRRSHGPPPPKRGRIESDSEEEYDSEMDDFIDDGEEELDYSSEIKRMFGYDKSKYADEDDDCDDMEASYSQLQKEEKRSAQLGLKEDLEDIRREEEEKKRKKQRLKMMNKGRR